MKFYRHPKGYKKAVINKARKGAIPPTAWDDKRVWVSKLYYHYSRRIWVSNMNFDGFAAKMKAKFPKINREEIRYHYYNQKDWENSEYLRSKRFKHK